ncbi:hypothetical protein A3B84_00605 [Candidatus Nomurabacteria bacterium RIFCSPHIGHO2_02_FULL_35_13]|uniref:Uncharacterized protein n=1 Tax=Candidatus Nomurabacteria bacterium RIFCSPHIGHO2_02_FULL_35_13 TaxID=1801748 RepID=A0A1F6VNU8_9BACT|nr:MAG: hypothetical protein A3B84_00605 [Candidatus Nomurabacteria bacterium RIFCSPHIGHO2_02_FULL_35_13]
MENMSTNEQESVKIFQDLISILKELEERDGEINLEKVNPKELGGGDKDFYNDFRLGNLTAEKMAKHLNWVSAFGNESQKKFHDYVANKIGMIES